MQHLLRFGLLLWLGVLLQSSLPAQDSLRLDLEACIAYALDHNPTVQNARFDTYIAQAQVKEVMASGYPQVNGTVDLQYFPSLPTTILPGDFNPVVDPVTGETRPGDPLEVRFGFPWQSTAGIGINQLFFDGTFFIGLKGARTYEELSIRAADRTREETALAVSQAYFQALMAKEQLALIDANLLRVRKLFTETRALNEAGFAEKIDVDRLQINLTNLELEREKIDRFVVLARTLLKFQMGMPVDQPLALKGSVSELAEAPAPPLSLGDLDPTNRVEYRLLQTQERIEQYNTQRIRAGYLPSLYGFSNMQVNAQRDAFDFFDTNQKWFPIVVMGFQLNVPIFDGFRKRAQVQQSQLELRKIRNQFDQFALSMQVEVQTAYHKMQDAYNTVQATQANVELARRVYEVAEIKYREGVGSSLEINDAESQLKQAEANYLNGMYQYLMAELELQKARGEFSRYHQEE
ncbi:MAG: TolC family protein [Bacteroidetes bacterium]|nr:MAG: TolC family protein [Bacteroidota bacterium]